MSTFLPAMPYIENLSVSTTESELQKLFLQAGTVNYVWMSKDRKSGRSIGFAYLEMSNQAEAEKAIEMFSGYVLDGHNLRVNYANRHDEHNIPAPGSNSGQSRPIPRKGGNKP
jgi:RNA recognition motif-containing protein